MCKRRFFFYHTCASVAPIIAVMTQPRLFTRHDWIHLYAPRFSIPEDWGDHLGSSPAPMPEVDCPIDCYSLEHKQGAHIHQCLDSDTESFPIFPFGPLLRDCGSCTELIPMSCAFCDRVSNQPCRNVYRVALTGADWHGFRHPHHPLRETGVLVECSHCGAPGEFHVNLALFKGYYIEVLDLVRKGCLSLFDVRRSVNVVAEWPPEPGRPLIRLISQLANQLAGVLIDSPLPAVCGAIVLEYWQGAGPDYLLGDSTFVRSFDEMYKCTHGWPCTTDDGVRQYCLWTQWSQQWLHELHVCDGRIAIPRYHCTQYLPRTWDEWVERRAPEWIEPDGIDRTNVPIPSGERSSLTMPRTAFARDVPGGYRVLRSVQLPGHRPLGLMKMETRLSMAWYTMSVL